MLDKSLTLVGRWSGEYDWVRRAATYDRHLERVRLEARCAAVAREAARDAGLWERRNRASLEAHWRLAVAMRGVAGAMLALPLVETRVEEVDGRSVTTTRPGKWTFRYAAALARAAVEIEAAMITAATKSLDEMGLHELMAVAGVDDEADPGEVLPDEAAGDGAGPAAPED